MATNQSWKLEDLHDLGLAEELQSGLYLSEFGSDDMKDIIDSLMEGSSNDQSNTSIYNVDDEQPFVYEGGGASSSGLYQITSTPVYPNSNISCTLKAPTASCTKNDETTVTYLNRGQPYVINISSNGPHISDYKSFILLEFINLKLRNSEETQLQIWSQDHPGQRMIDIDMSCSSGISNVQHIEGNINKASFVWSSQHGCVLSIKIHSLSSEFTAKKHGGEKGAPFRLVVDSYSLDDDGMNSLIAKSCCVVKVFKDKGADRKQKQDIQKREKLPPEEAMNYWPCYPVTILQSLDISGEQQEHKSPSRHYCRSSTSSGGCGSVQSSPSTTVPSSDHDQLSPYFNVDETRQWLTSNRFASYVSLFVNYGGGDLLRLSRKDLMDLCGAADGIRMYNTIHSKTIMRLYITFGDQSTYHALFLDGLTVDKLREAISNKLNLLPSIITAIHIQHHNGILVIVDDLCVRNMHDEQCFIIHPVKNEDGSVQLIMKSPSLAPVSLSGLQSRTE